MRGARRNLGDGFGLSFLDVLCCGLGAAILLLLIVKHEEPGLDQSDWALMLEPEIFEIRQAVEEYKSENKLLEKRTLSLKERLSESEQKSLRRNKLLTQQQKKLIDLKTQLAKEEAKSRELSRLTTRLKEPPEPLESKLDIKGLNFGALSGLQFSGEERVVILLDNSASMIDWSVVEIVRTQAAGRAAIESAFKWQQAQSVANWAFTSIESGKRYKFLTFAERVLDANGKEVSAINEVSWDLKSEDDTKSRLRNLSKLPEGGTNLKVALEAVSRLVPKPKRILLITDGLPNKIENRGAVLGCPSSSKTVRMISGDCRTAIALASLDTLSEKLARVPIDVILLPLEGDPRAVRMYSLISGISSGRLITPSSDWLLTP
ncbi:VWA domain-containing protein [Luminiphilus sp.]|nr:VWA domain-containing protein [Luminiphilus sp.]